MMSLFVLNFDCVRLLSENLETKVTNLDDYACPKVQNLIFKDEKSDRRCSKHSHRHQKFFAAEKKAFAYGTGNRCCFNKL